MARVGWIGLAAAFAISGCDGKRATPGPGSGSSTASAGGAGSGSGSARSSDGYTPSGTRPVNPKRPAPPASMTPLAVGAEAPAIALSDHTGAAWTLAGSLAKVQRVVLVYYRGDW